MFSTHSRLISTIAMIVLLASVLSPFHTNAASPAGFVNANSAINSAFSATYNAQQNGGNVTTLVETLNSAIALVQKAQSENSTNPSQATADLQSAIQLAQQVSSEAPSIGQAGAAARQLVVEESVAGIIAIGILGALVYLYGGRIYRIIWFILYSNHVVRRSG